MIRADNRQKNKNLESICFTYSSDIWWCKMCNQWLNSWLCYWIGDTCLIGLLRKQTCLRCSVLMEWERQLKDKLSLRQGQHSTILYIHNPIRFPTINSDSRPDNQLRYSDSEMQIGGPCSNVRTALDRAFPRSFPPQKDQPTYLQFPLSLLFPSLNLCPRLHVPSFLFSRLNENLLSCLDLLIFLCFGTIGTLLSQATASSKCFYSKAARWRGYNHQFELQGKKQFSFWQLCFCYWCTLLKLDQTRATLKSLNVRTSSMHHAHECVLFLFFFLSVPLQKLSWTLLEMPRPLSFLRPPVMAGTLLVSSPPL